MTPSLPQRVVGAAEAQARYGALADQLFAAMHRLDPRADAVVEAFAELPRSSGWSTVDAALGGDTSDAPEPLRALLAHLESTPAWVDWDRVDRAGRLFFRTGAPGGIVLGAKSLCYGYCAPAGNKPLVFTGQLERSVGRRLAETSRFVVATCERDGLRRGGAGFAATVRVRLMHAQVRRMLRRSGRWDDDAWGPPINQHDMVATGLLFSQSFLEGVRQFGFDVSREEADDYIHLWNLSSWLMGVEEELLPGDEDEARRMADLILATQGPPDEDSRRLVDALVRSPELQAETPAEERRAALQVSLGYGFCRALLGNDLADALSLPRDGWRFVVPAVGRVVAAIEPWRRLIPAVDEAFVRRGRRYWEDNIRLGMGGRPIRFAAPERLAASPAG